MAETGSVLFLYDRMGRVIFDGDSSITEDEVLELCMEAGIDDYVFEEAVAPIATDDEDEGSAPRVFVDQTSLKLLTTQLDAGDVHYKSAELCYRSKAPIDVNDEDLESNLGLIDVLEGLEDVDLVEHSMEMN